MSILTAFQGNLKVNAGPNDAAQEGKRETRVRGVRQGVNTTEFGAPLMHGTTLTLHDLVFY